jgi:hypothetical protein
MARLLADLVLLIFSTAFRKCAAAAAVMSIR